LTDDRSAKLNEPVREPHRHPGWHHRNARLVCFGTGGWLRSESVAGFVGIRSWLPVSLILSALPFVLSGNRTMRSVGFGLLSAAAASLLT
jgi:hypothetical protein